MKGFLGIFSKILIIRITYLNEYHDEFQEKHLQDILKKTLDEFLKEPLVEYLMVFLEISHPLRFFTLFEGPEMKKKPNCEKVVTVL